MSDVAPVLALEDIATLLGQEDPGGRTAVGPEIRDGVEALLFDEAALLDARDYGQWLELFHDPCCYWVPLDRGSALPWDALNLVFDHRPQLEDRIYRYDIGNVWSQEPPSETARVVGNVKVRPVDAPDHYVATSRFVLVETRQGDVRTYAGRYRHVVAGDADTMTLVGKRAEIINSQDFLPSLTFML